MARYQTNNLPGIGLMYRRWFLLSILRWYVWATLIGHVIWLDIPSTEVWTGAVINIGSGLYVIHRDSLRHRAQVCSGG